MAVDLLITNGTIVTPDTSFRGHLLIDAGKQLDILLRDGDLPAARETVDATGLHVLPGLIDSHVHFREPGLDHKEDWITGSQAAVCGGITTVIDMPNVIPPTIDPEALAAKLELARGRSYCDYGLRAALVPGSLGWIVPLAAAGVCGFKVFMGETTGGLKAPDEEELVAQWRAVAATGLRLGVHAEDRALLRQYRTRLAHEGRTDPLAFVEARPPAAEARAARQAVRWACETGCQLMLHHLSSRQGVEVLRQAKAGGGCDVAGETAPHYLLFEAQDMLRLNLGSLLRVNPPLREREDGEALWQALDDGTIDVLASDHAPHTRAEKRYEDRMGDIWRAASGIPGVETSVPLMLTAVHEGRLTLGRYVELQAEDPARCWNLWPAKGRLGRGADGDVTIVDLEQEIVVDENRLHSKAGHSPWHGWRVRGVPICTIVGGRVVVREGEVVAPQPDGRFVRPRL